ncbi:MAG TPA: response regulator, partial [Allocoleopsis sp.]
LIIDTFAINNTQNFTEEKKPNLDVNFAQEYPLQILVAEDNPTNQKLMRFLLKRLGYEIDIVGNGKEAIKALEKRFYNLILMDVQMPEMDGLTATKNIRELFNRQPWIIGLSANAFAEDRELALSVGMNNYLTKPLKIESLVEALLLVKS